MSMIPKHLMSEEDIKLQFITPAVTAKWDISKITMETKLTDGKINLKGNFVVREKPKRADYVLYLAPNNTIAIIEAKDNTEFAAMAAGFELLECNVPGHSLIRFTVDHYGDDDGREKSNREVVPFQVAYAISIHKAQGLEYNSVKVVVTNEIEEQITHNIFYTAITRARKKIKIYWTPETQHKVLTEMEPLSCKRDAFIISNKHNISIANKNG